MARVILGILFLIGVGWFVRHQFDAAMKAATTRSPQKFVASPFSAARQDSRIKCMMCGGTGRSTFVGLSNGHVQQQNLPNMPGDGVGG